MEEEEEEEDEEDEEEVRPLEALLTVDGPMFMVVGRHILNLWSCDAVATILPRDGLYAKVKAEMTLECGVRTRVFNTYSPLVVSYSQNFNDVTAKTTETPQQQRRRRRQNKSEKNLDEYHHGWKTKRQQMGSLPSS